MINVETFSQTLFNDHNFQQLLRENVHSLSLELRERDLEQTRPFRRIVQEINKYILEITENVLRDDNSENFLAFMRRNEQLYQQQEKRFTSLLQKKMQSFRDQILEILQGFKQYRKNQAETGGISQMVQERKDITKSIRDFNRRGRSIECEEKQNNFAKELSIMLPLNSKPSKLKTNLKNKRDLENFNNTNLEQESYKKDRHAVKQTLIDVQQTMNSLLEEQKLHQKRSEELRLEFQEQLQQGLESIWNVQSELQGRISKIETALSKYMKKKL